jgi:hypothetical protein
MSINPRQKRRFKSKLLTCIFLLIIFGTIVFFLNLFFISRKQLFISPVSKSNNDLSFVKKILKDNDVQFTEVILSDYSYLVSIQNNGQVRLSQDKDVIKQVASLQKILGELTIEGKAFKSVDLRFAEPVIVF